MPPKVPKARCGKRRGEFAKNSKSGRGGNRSPQAYIEAVTKNGNAWLLEGANRLHNLRAERDKATAAYRRAVAATNRTIDEVLADCDNPEDSRERYPEVYEAGRHALGTEKLVRVVDAVQHALAILLDALVSRDKPAYKAAAKVFRKAKEEELAVEYRYCTFNAGDTVRDHTLMATIETYAGLMGSHNWWLKK